MAYQTYQVLISLKVILVFLLLFPFLSEWRPLGVLIIVVTEMARTPMSQHGGTGAPTTYPPRALAEGTRGQGRSS